MVSRRLDLALFLGVKHLRKRQSMLHDEKELLLRQSGNVIKLGGPGMLPQEMLKLRSSEIAGKVYFSVYFCVFKVFKVGN